MIDENDLQMWRDVRTHLDKMQNEPEYKAKTEALLYAGAQKELQKSLSEQISRASASENFALDSAIRELAFVDENLGKIQATTINLATKHTEILLRAYCEHQGSAHGRYICSDTFKELLLDFLRQAIARWRVTLCIMQAQFWQRRSFAKC